MQMWTKFLGLTALVLTLTLSLCDLSWAQPQVRNPPSQGNQPGYCQGRGPGSAYCPANAGNSGNRPQGPGYGRGPNRGMGRGPRGNQPANATTPQNPPEATQ